MRTRVVYTLLFSNVLVHYPILYACLLSHRIFTALPHIRYSTTCPMLRHTFAAPPICASSCRLRCVCQLRGSSHVPCVFESRLTFPIYAAAPNLRCRSPSLLSLRISAAAPDLRCHFPSPLPLTISNATHHLRRCSPNPPPFSYSAALPRCTTAPPGKIVTSTPPELRSD